MKVETNTPKIGCLVLNLSLGRDGKHYQSKIDHFLKRNGPEWTVRRCKAIWNIALLLRDGDVDKAISVCKENSIAYRRASGIPKGIEGRIIKRFLSARKLQVVKRLTSALRFYTSIRFLGLTRKQYDKAMNAITGPSTKTIKFNLFDMGYNLTVQLLKEKGLRSYKIGDITQMQYRSDLSHAEHLHGSSKYYSRYKVPKDLRAFPYSSFALSTMTETWMPTHLLDEITPCKEMRDEIREINKLYCDVGLCDRPELEIMDDTFAGKITFIQEQGGKARVVAQPSAWLQLAFRPLHTLTQRITRKLFPTESCVEDQLKGAYTIYQHMVDGGTPASVDLSSATDRFPRDFTLGVLEAVGLHGYAEALDITCRKAWLVQENSLSTGRVYAYYSVGQPMGLYGSFPIFNLSNCILCKFAMKMVKDHSTKHSYGRSFRDGTYFRVLGDDVVFSNRTIANAYKALVKAMGVDISESKSYSGRNVTEFAGFLCLRDKGTVSLYRPYKVPDGTYISNPIQFLDSLGCKVKTLKRGWEKVYNSYSRTRHLREADLSPLFRDVTYTQPSPNRADNQTMISICQHLYGTDLRDQLPDLSGSTKINKYPLFRERQVFDHYGFNPDTYRKDNPTYRDQFHPLRSQISRDPLIHMDKLRSSRRTSSLER